MIVGDFNHDGKPDLAITNYYAATVSIMLGNGDGTFQSPVTYATGNLPNQLVTADFNGDGNLDLAVANDDSDSVSVLLGNGNGTFQPQVEYVAGVARMRSWLATSMETGRSIWPRPISSPTMFRCFSAMGMAHSKIR